MKISLGTENFDKVEAFQEALQFLGAKGETNSLSREENFLPFTDEETLYSAIFYAQKSRKSSKSDLGLSLEDGVEQLGSKLFVVCWGALVDANENLFICSSARIPIPEETAQLIHRDQSLAHGNPAYVDQAVQKSIGAMGLLTSGINTLKDEYLHMIRVLVGQFKQGQNSLNATDFASTLLSQEFQLS